jgi:dephospho-CoA kinase
VAALAEIAIYTQEDQVPLWDVFRNLHQMGMTESAITEAVAGEDTLVALFKQALPEYDADRVYVSDMRKALRWFLALQGRVDFNASLDPEGQEAVGAQE